MTAVCLLLMMVGTAFAYSASAASGNDSADGEELPTFRPSIADKMKYQKFYKQENPAVPINESELTHLLFSGRWVEKHDQDPRRNVVKLTFAASRLNELPKGRGTASDSGYKLRIPKKMLLMDDMDEDPETITIRYPKDMFVGKGSENTKKLGTPPAQSGQRNSPPVSSTSSSDPYQERWWVGATKDNIIRATGVIDPYENTNNGQALTSYHESEIYFNRDGDLAEIISELEPDGDAEIWAAIYDEGDWVTPGGWLLVESTSYQPIEYYVYISDGVYDIWFKNTNTGEWVHDSYDDTDNPATAINWIVSSTELYIDGVTNSFNLITWPLKTEWVYSDGWTKPAKIFDNYGRDVDGSYVYTWSYFNSDDEIVGYHEADNNPDT